MVLKHAFYLFSIASTLAGALFIWFSLSMLRRLQFINTDPNAVLTLSAMGAGLAVIALIGAYGSIKRSHVPILLHGIFHSGIFCFSITVMLFIWIKMKPLIKHAISEAFVEKFTDNFLIIDSTMDTIQRTYKCCGKFSYLDYMLDVPHSCYMYNPCTEDSFLNTEGCFSAVISNLRNEFFLAKFGAVVIIVLELLTVISSLSYANALKAKVEQEKDVLVAEVMY